MFRLTRGRVLAAVLVLAVIVFLSVKLVHTSRRPPPIEIHVEGTYTATSRAVLTHALEKLFPKGNGAWKVVPEPAGDAGPRCRALAAAYRSSPGRAVSASYEFAGWLEVRLADYVYADAAAARHPVSVSLARRAEVCQAQEVVEALRREGYAVGKPRTSGPTKVAIGGGGATIRTQIPSRFKGRKYTWDLDSTGARSGRVVLVVGTLVAEPFATANQLMTRELVSGAL